MFSDIVGMICVYFTSPFFLRIRVGVQGRRVSINGLLMLQHCVPIKKLKMSKISVEHVTNPEEHKNQDFSSQVFIK